MNDQSTNRDYPFPDSSWTGDVENIFMKPGDPNYREPIKVPVGKLVSLQELLEKVDKQEEEIKALRECIDRLSKVVTLNLATGKLVYPEEESECLKSDMSTNSQENSAT